jgi:hypothetical protein
MCDQTYTNKQDQTLPEYVFKAKIIKFLKIDLYSCMYLCKYYIINTIMFEFKLHAYYQVKQDQLKHFLTVEILHNQHQIFPLCHCHIHIM